MKHLFIDFETFGQDVKDCAVIDMSAYVVNTDKMLSSDPYTLKNIVDIKKFKISVKDQVANYGFKVYADTVAFWETQPEQVRKHIKPLSTDLSVQEFIDQFLEYLTESGRIDYWWSRSNTFDPLLLWRLAHTQDKYKHINEHIPYWKIRDIRSYIDAKLDFPKVNGFVPIEDEAFWEKVFMQHNSTWDVLADVLRMQTILRAENDMEQVKR